MSSRLGYELGFAIIQSAASRAANVTSIPRNRLGDVLRDDSAWRLFQRAVHDATPQHIVDLDLHEIPADADHTFDYIAQFIAALPGDKRPGHQGESDERFPLERTDFILPGEPRPDDDDYDDGDDCSEEDTSEDPVEDDET